MHSIRAAVLFTLIAAAAHANAERAQTRYFDLVNTTHDSVTSLAAALPGNGEFRDIELGGPLRGGNALTTVEIPEGGCLRDLRVVFSDGRTLIYPGIDVCRYRLHLRAKDGKSR